MMCSSPSIRLNRSRYRATSTAPISPLVRRQGRTWRPGMVARPPTRSLSTAWAETVLPPTTGRRNTAKRGANLTTTTKAISLPATNTSKPSSDLHYQNDSYLSSSKSPGEAIKARAEATFAKGAALLVTVPLIGYVAADNDGPMDTLDATRAERLATRFNISSPFKRGPLSTSPNTHDHFVYQDEFVNWVE